MLKSSLKLIVGLGNIGSEYERTRHNYGFMLIDEMANENQIELKESKKLLGFVGKGEIEQVPVVLLKPTTFMNLSGHAVLKCLQFYKVAREDLIILTDEASLKFSDIKLKPGGSSAGHNGLKHIESLLGNKYARLKLGIGYPKGHKELADYVLERFTDHEMELLPKLLKHSAHILKVWLKSGLEAAMKLANTKKNENKDEVS